MEFENACSEMYYILEHMNPSDRDRIPKSTIQFFRDNRSMFYKVNLDVTKDLSKQELKDETKAFIQIINEKYFSDMVMTKIETSQVKEQIGAKQLTALINVKKENKILIWFKNLFRKFLH